jgi:hypothetical protein
MNLEGEDQPPKKQTPPKLSNNQNSHSINSVCVCIVALWICRLRRQNRRHELETRASKVRKITLLYIL